MKLCLQLLCGVCALGLSVLPVSAGPADDLKTVEPPTVSGGSGEERPPQTVIVPDGQGSAAPRRDVIIVPGGRTPERETTPTPPEGNSDGGVLVVPDGRLPQPDMPVTPEGGVTIVPVVPEKQVPPTTPATPPEKTTPPQTPDVVVTPVQPTTPAEQPKTAPPAPGRQPEIWELLPQTDIPPDMAQEKPKAATPEVKDGKKTSEPKKPEATPLPKKPDPIKPDKEMPKPEKKKDGKPKVGEPLRIPPEAAKTGNLDFLEGCWQGTRPEYYSKRIVKECFCFGKGGGNGKRRVIDPKGGRNCIGSTQARLNSNGVLSVTSGGAYCTDGERWGASQMTCRGSGRSTPCSWIFTDAEGGRQAYEIPFIRVDSCGGRP